MADIKTLVVEDSPTMRQLLVATLRRLPQLQIVEAEDGVDALRKLQGAQFQLLITDINMPVMDGLKLVGMVRKDGAHRDIPIVIITTEGADGDKQRALNLGANAYITKPIKAPEVLETIGNLLRL